jgi:phosphate transport system substrate-binding protein
VKHVALLLAGFLALSGGGPGGVATAADRPAGPAAALRLWASPADRALVEQLEAAFAAQLAGVRFDNRFHGPESTLAGVYTGVADLAVLARELREPMERMAFEWALLSKPFEVPFAHGGLEADRPGTQLAVIVHRDNPLTRLSLGELEAILGGEPRHAAGTFRSWGRLGLGGTWRKRAIRVYGPPVDTIPALHLRHVVLGDSRKWTQAYRERAAGVVDEVARDRDAIGFAPASAADARVKRLELSVESGGPSYALTAATVRAGTWPLARTTTIVLHRAPDAPLDFRLKQFLHYVLSDAGQAIVARDGAHLALDPARAQQIRQSLD